MQQIGSYSRSVLSASTHHTTASRLLTESYSRCNRPGATPGLTTETAHILRDDETASLLLTVSYSRATKAPTPWHTRLHPDTSRSKISEQQCLAGPGSPHNDRSDGKPKFRRIPADSGGNPEFRRKSSGFRRKSRIPAEIQRIPAEIRARAPRNSTDHDLTQI